jgi:hypothetical protein
MKSTSAVEISIHAVLPVSNSIPSPCGRHPVRKATA